MKNTMENAMRAADLHKDEILRHAANNEYYSAVIENAVIEGKARVSGYSVFVTIGNYCYCGKVHGDKLVQWSRERA